jgi:hypothetical protein
LSDIKPAKEKVGGGRGEKSANILCFNHNF